MPQWLPSFKGYWWNLQKFGRWRHHVLWKWRGNWGPQRKPVFENTWKEQLKPTVALLPCQAASTLSGSLYEGSELSTPILQCNISSAYYTIARCIAPGRLAPFLEKTRSFWRNYTAPRWTDKHWHLGSPRQKLSGYPIIFLWSPQIDLLLPGTRASNPETLDFKVETLINRLDYLPWGKKGGGGGWAGRMKG